MTKAAYIHEANIRFPDPFNDESYDLTFTYETDEDYDHTDYIIYSIEVRPFEPNGFQVSPDRLSFFEEFDFLERNGFIQYCKTGLEFTLKCDEYLDRHEHDL